MLDKKGQLQVELIKIKQTPNMKLSLTRIDATMPLPKYETSGSVGFDFYSRIDMEIQPQSLGLIPLNIIIKVPEDYMLLVVPRSSTPRKKGLLIPHGIGVVDQDYCGEKDEVLFQVYNFTKDVVTIQKGERVAQGLIVRIATPELVEGIASKKSRGGLGSTG